MVVLGASQPYHISKMDRYLFLSSLSTYTHTHGGSVSVSSVDRDGGCGPGMLVRVYAYI